LCVCAVLCVFVCSGYVCVFVCLLRSERTNLPSMSMSLNLRLLFVVQAANQNLAAADAAHEAAMNHQEELMKAEEKKNAAKDEANTKLLEAMKSGNVAAQKAAEGRLASAKKMEEQSKAASKKQIEAAKVATERAIKAQDEAREREKQMEESKKDLEKDLKHEGEKTTEVRIELAKSQARAEAAEKAAEEDPKCCGSEGDASETVRDLELKVSHLEGRLEGHGGQCGGSGPCDLGSGGDKGTDEGAIQTAVDAAVSKLINKTRERKSQEDAIESVEEKNEEREEVLKAERDTIVNEKMELEKEKEEAESKAKEEDADLTLERAQAQKTKLENGKLKSDMLNLQQTLTKMGEEKMELNNRLTDLSTPAS
jgi:hypothetical protein